MPGIPVVIASNGKGIPVKQVTSGAPVMTVATNGLGTPIVLTDRGTPFVVQGGDAPVDFNFQTFTMTAGGVGQWVGYSDGGPTRPQPAFGSINMQPTAVTTLLAFYDDTASGVMLAVFSGDYVDDLDGLQVSIGGYIINSFEVELISGNTWVRFNGLPGDLSVGANYEVLFGFSLSPVYDASTVAWANAMTVPPDNNLMINMDILVKSLKSSGVWTVRDLIYVMAMPNAQAAQINVKNPTGPNTLTPMNSPVFTANVGYAGDGSGSYLGTGYFFTASNQFLQDNAGISAYANRTPAEGNNNDPVVGMDTTAGTLTFLRPRDGTGGMGGRINSTTNDNSGAVATRLGYKAMSRINATQVQFYSNDGNPLGGALTRASAAMQNKELLLLRLGTGYGRDGIAAHCAGGAPTNAQVLAERNAILTFLTSVGAN